MYTANSLDKFQYPYPEGENITETTNNGENIYLHDSVFEVLKSVDGFDKDDVLEMICDDGITEKEDTSYIVKEASWSVFIGKETEKINCGEDVYYHVLDTNHYIKKNGKSAFNLYTRSEYKFDILGEFLYHHAGVFATKEEAELEGKECKVIQET